MNKFEQRLRNLVPELGDIPLNTRNCFEQGLEVVEAVQKGLCPDPGDGFLMVLMAGIFYAFNPDQTVSIGVSQDVESVLNDEEIRALVLHELGHVKNEDYRLAVAGEAWMDNKAIEVAADRYAIDCGVDPKVLWEAVKKITAFAVRRVIAWKIVVQNMPASSFDVEKAVQATYDVAHIQDAERYNALFPNS